MGIGRMSDFPPYLKALVYGFPGVGKTTLVTSALDVPYFCPLLFVDADRGTLSVRDRAEHPSLFYFPVERYEEMNLVYGAVSNLEAYRKKFPDDVLPDVPFRTVVIDDLLELYYKGLQMVMKEAKAKSEGKKDMLQPSQPDYGKARFLIHKLLRNLRDLPVNVLVTNQAAREKDVFTGALHVSLNAIGKLANEVPVFFDIYAYLKVSKGVRLLQLVPTERTQSKDRATKESELVDPTIAKLVAICPHVPADN